MKTPTEVICNTIFFLERKKQNRTRGCWRNINEAHDLSLCEQLYQLALVYFQRKALPQENENQKCCQEKMTPNFLGFPEMEELGG